MSSFDSPASSQTPADQPPPDQGQPDTPGQAGSADGARPDADRPDSSGKTDAGGKDSRGFGPNYVSSVDTGPPSLTGSDKDPANPFPPREDQRTPKADGGEGLGTGGGGHGGGGRGGGGGGGGGGGRPEGKKDAASKAGPSGEAPNTAGGGSAPEASGGEPDSGGAGTSDNGGGGMADSSGGGAPDGAHDDGTPDSGPSPQPDTSPRSAPDTGLTKPPEAGRTNPDATTSSRGPATDTATPARPPGDNGSTTRTGHDRVTYATGPDSTAVARDSRPPGGADQHHSADRADPSGLRALPEESLAEAKFHPPIPDESSVSTVDIVRPADDHAAAASPHDTHTGEPAGESTQQPDTPPQADAQPGSPDQPGKAEPPPGPAQPSRAHLLLAANIPVPAASSPPPRTSSIAYLADHSQYANPATALDQNLRAHGLQLGEQTGQPAAKDPVAELKADLNRRSKEGNIPQGIFPEKQPEPKPPAVDRKSHAAESTPPTLDAHHSRKEEAAAEQAITKALHVDPKEIVELLQSQGLIKSGPIDFSYVELRNELVHRGVMPGEHRPSPDQTGSQLEIREPTKGENEVARQWQAQQQEAYRREHNPNLRDAVVAQSEVLARAVDRSGQQGALIGVFQTLYMLGGDNAADAHRKAELADAVFSLAPVAEKGGASLDHNTTQPPQMAEVRRNQSAHETARSTHRDSVSETRAKPATIAEKNAAGDALSAAAEKSFRAAMADTRPPIRAHDLGRIGIVSDRQAFRAEVTRIVSDRNHPLHFLAESGKLERSTARGMDQVAWRESPATIEAGHTTSASALAEGAKADRFVVMSAHENRLLAATVEHPGKGAWMVTDSALVIGGVPVDPVTARDWVAAGLLKPEILASARRVAY